MADPYLVRDPSGETTAPMSRHPLSRLLATLTLVVACSGGTPTTAPPPPPPPPPVTVTVNPTTLDLLVEETATVTATVANSSAGVTWSSMNPAVATVSNTGLVTAVGEGSTMITATVVGQSNVSASVAVTVTAPSVEVGMLMQDGQALDLNAVTGEFTVVVTAVLPAQFTGVVEVLLGGEVAGSVELVDGVVLSPPGPGALGQAPADSIFAEGGQSVGTVRRIPESRELPIPVQTLAITDMAPIDLNTLPATGLTPKFPNGSYPLTMQARTDLRGLATGTGPNLVLVNRSAVAYLDSRIVGTTQMNPANGRVYSNGDYHATLVNAPYDGGTFQSVVETIERVEVLKGPTMASIYGTTASSGIINIVRRRSDPPGVGGLADMEGTHRVTQLEVTTDVAGPYQPIVLNSLDWFANHFLREEDMEHDIDHRGPQFRDPFAFTIDLGRSDAWIGKSVTFDWRAANEGFTMSGTDPSVFDEGVGIKDWRYNVGPDGNNLDPTPVTKGGDIAETLTPSLTLRATWRDWFDNEGSIDHSDGIGMFTPIGVDYGSNIDINVLSMFNGQPGIVRGDVNVPPGRKLYWEGMNFGPSGFAGHLVTAGLDAPGLTPEEACAEGTFDPDYDPDPGPFSMCRPTWFPPTTTGEYEPMFLATLSGSAIVNYRVGARDRAYNKRYAYVPTVQDEVPPTPGGFVPQQTYASGVSASFTWSLTDNLTVAATGLAFQYQDDPVPLILDAQEWYHRIPGQTGGFVMSAQPSAGFVFPGWLESSMTNAFDRDVPSGMGAPVQRLIYGGTDAAGNLGQAAHDFGNTVQGGFLSLMTSGFDGASLRFMTLEVCHNPKGKGDCGGTPETVTQTVEMFFMPGATDPFDRLRFSKRLTLGGTEGDYLFPDANRVETDFGSFRLVEYSQTFMGEELPPGTYTMGAYGFGGGTAWRMGRQFFLSVKPAF